MLEKNLQKKIIDFLEKKGFECIKLINTNKNGIPDLLVLGEDGNFFWIEVKTKKGHLSPLQKFRIKNLLERKNNVLIPYGWEDFLKKINYFIN